MEGLRTNSQIELAHEFLRSTGANIFLTGKAGTGKTTFLRSVVESVNKRTVVAAPTGVAALNARGVTLHSLFQLPFGLYLPGIVATSDTQHRKIGRKKLSLIRSIELLIIDEISMVRCDVLDAVDDTLRRIRRNNAPFGGVQLLMIGDIEQLSPICRDDEWALLSQHYSSPYFFASKALARCQYITIELKEIFRQTDQHFTHLLNAVRENKITREVVDALNKRYLPNFKAPLDGGYITLTTHNHSATSINKAALKELKSPTQTFEAAVRGDYPESAYPNDASLELKVGAQVIFIKNDISPEKLYYNGLIGRIESLERGSATVAPSSGGDPITVSAVMWENVEYRLNEESGQIEESIKGTYSQIPLKCAWAITIHKSQGLSFEHAIIDAGQSFAHGQVYVALSRCRTFEGMVLRTPISGGSIIRDNSVESFTEAVSAQSVGTAELEAHRRDYFLSQLSEIFDFEEFNRLTYSLSKLLNAALYREYPNLCTALRESTTALNGELQRVGEGFKAQLKRAVSQSADYKSDEYIATRLAKASAYFTEHISPLCTLIEECSKVKPDAKEVSKRLKLLLAEAHEAAAIKACALELCANGFSCEEYLRRKGLIIAQADGGEPKKGKGTKEAKATKGAKEAKSVSLDIVNEELYNTLTAWRLELARSSQKPAYTVLTNRTLIEIQATCPTSIEALSEISGIGKQKLSQYGDQIIEIVQEYALYNNSSDE